MPSATIVVLPSVFYDSATKTICFTSEVNRSELPIEISDEDGNVLMEEYVAIEPEKVTIMDVNVLLSGIYNITMWVEGRAYVGVFEIEE